MQSRAPVCIFRRHMATMSLASMLASPIGLELRSSAQSTTSSIQFDSDTHVFRIDAGKSTYAFGINDVQGLQTSIGAGIWPRLTTFRPHTACQDLRRSIFPSQSRRRSIWAGEAESSLSLT